MSQKTLARARKAEPPKTAEPRWKRWAREWAVTLVVLAVVAVMVSGGVEETTTGLVASALFVGAAVWLSAMPVAAATPDRRVALWLYGFAAIWALTAFYPLYRLVRPGQPVATARLPEEGKEAAVKLPATGRYTALAYVDRRAVPGEVTYRLGIAAGGAEQVERGTFSRTMTGGGPRGTTASVIHANRHEVVARSAEVKVKLDGLDGTLSEPLEVRFFREPIPYVGFQVWQVLLVIAAAILDALFADRKSKSMLTVGALCTLVFIETAHAGVTPSRIMRPLIGAGILAIVVGSVGGWLLNLIARAAASAARRRAAA